MDPTPSTSPAGTVNSVDHWKSLRTAGITLLSVFLMSGIQAVIQALKCADPSQCTVITFGGPPFFQMIVVGVFAYLLDLLRRYFMNYVSF